MTPEEISLPAVAQVVAESYIEDDDNDVALRKQRTVTVDMHRDVVKIKNGEVRWIKIYY